MGLYSIAKLGASLGAIHCGVCVIYPLLRQEAVTERALVKMLFGQFMIGAGISQIAVKSTEDMFAIRERLAERDTLTTLGIGLSLAAGHHVVSWGANLIYSGVQEIKSGEYSAISVVKVIHGVSSLALIGVLSANTMGNSYTIS